MIHGDEFLFIAFTTQIERFQNAFSSPSASSIHRRLSPVLSKKWKEPHLQSVLEELVELGDLGRDAEVNGPVADFDDQAALDVGVDLSMLVGCPAMERRVSPWKRP